MLTVVVTFCQNEYVSVDLEIPLSVPLYVLAPVLVEVLPWSHLAAKNDDEEYHDQVQNKRLVVRPHESRHSAGIEDGAVLELFLATKVLDEILLSAPEGLTEYLQCVSTGKAFPLQGHNVLIGRLPNLPVNLAGLPGEDYVSRVHANIIRRRDGSWIKDERSRNGTIVDGITLESGERVLIRDGSRIQFGIDGPVLLFCSRK